MNPTETLKHEHQIVLLIMQAAESEVKHIAETGSLRHERIEQIVDFSKNFTDRCHHAKEEKHLFVMLQQRGIPSGSGPVAMMLAEHEMGRKLIRTIAEALLDARAGKASAMTSVKDNLKAYVELLRNHIQKEDNVLFPMADRLLSAADQQALAAEFERVEAEEMGEGTHEKYHQMAQGLLHE
jgi:hemerythrin-like domain-containing protein